MTDVVVCVDGLDPAYLDESPTPRWDEIADRGAEGTCEGVVPSLTNVNNVSIVTASFPDSHGITGNTFYDRERDELVYMEDPKFLRTSTVLEERAAAGETVAALVAKEKLERMVGRGCDVIASAESPPEWLTDAVGDAPDIYSGAASRWLLAAATHVIDEVDPDLLYVSTTDVVPHKHAPGTPPATEWVTDVDAGIGRLADRAETLVATADHGMNHKTTCLDVEAMLAEAGYPAEVIRLIRDKHTYHHQNLGGAAYVYLHEHDVDAIRWLADRDGIDAVLAAPTAAARFGLPTDRIGDAMLIGAPDAVFGPVEGATRESVDLRSHGSTHERRVPYLATAPVTLESNTDAFAVLP